MPTQLQSLLDSLLASDQLEQLRLIQHGIEKEGLRVDPNGRVSQTSHPKALGAALTHSRITTDYSEALLEFITPVFHGVEPALHYLEALHRYTYTHLGDETIWGASMPCRIDDPQEVPVGRYGCSNNGKMKHVYRLGLESRYGRVMQSIAGIHYNFSLPDAIWPLLQRLMTPAETSADQLQEFQSQSYFALLRNFRRHGWLLNYLFGASPALSRSFVGDQPHQLEEFDAETLYGPYATSLRMSDLGYTNQAQASLSICYNTLDNYIHTLSEAVATPYPAYEAMGVQAADGSYRQLNTNLLQIENEYYSDIRPKRVVKGNEKPLQALRDRGVEYVEIRSQDINPLLPTGIDSAQARFIDCFLLHCLLSDSTDISDSECDRLKANHAVVVNQGRKPGVQLATAEGSRGLQDWGAQLLDEVMKVAELMDHAHGSSCHTRSVQLQRAKLADVELTPSAKVLQLMRERGQGYTDFVIEQSRHHRDRLMAEPMMAAQRSELDVMAQRSIEQQQQMEQADQPSFEQFLANYFAS
ncbi:MAG: glutamate--cysteine ligase [Halopseudomonas sp.]